MIYKCYNRNIFNLKIKKLTKEQLIISADRLTRFKEPESKYVRVFRDIILNNIIEPKFKKSKIDTMDYEMLKCCAQNAINYSLPESDGDFLINQRLFDYETAVFNLNSDTMKLLKNKINYKALIKLLPTGIPDNLKWLKTLSDNIPDDKSFGFPVKKIILCEGITEEILLPVFAKICGYNFKNNGIHIVSAGGKNQVVKYFYNFTYNLKIPVFILLDNDAKDNLDKIKPKLREFDKLHILRSGEFEDLLPNSLISKTLNYATKNISFAPVEGLEKYTSKAKFLEEFFKHRGLHEFKKSEFANLVKQNINEESDVSEEIKDIIKELADLKIDFKFRQLNS